MFRGGRRAARQPKAETTIPKCTTRLKTRRAGVRGPRIPRVPALGTQGARDAGEHWLRAEREWRRPDGGLTHAGRMGLGDLIDDRG